MIVELNKVENDICVYIDLNNKKVGDTEPMFCLNLEKFSCIL